MIFSFLRRKNKKIEQEEDREITTASEKNKADLEAEKIAKIRLQRLNRRLSRL